MTVVTVPKITEDDLEKFMIYFGPENGEKIYEKYLRHFSNREIGELLGYTRRRKADGTITQDVKKGKFKVSRFKKMCDGLSINPQEIKSEYSSRVFIWKGRGGGWVEAEEPFKEAVWNTVCDGI